MCSFFVDELYLNNAGEKILETNCLITLLKHYIKKFENIDKLKHWGRKDHTSFLR